MARPTSYSELLRTVLDGLLEAIPADGGAILALKEGSDFERLAQRNRDPAVTGYPALPASVIDEVLKTREAILAEHGARARVLSGHETRADAGILSLLCVR